MNWFKTQLPTPALRNWKYNQYGVTAVHEAHVITYGLFDADFNNVMNRSLINLVSPTSSTFVKIVLDVLVFQEPILIEQLLGELMEFLRLIV